MNAEARVKRGGARAGVRPAGLAGAVILVTGSSSGIGRETANRFAREGARVILTWHRGRLRGEAAERQCRRLGAAEAMLLRLDVTDQRSVNAAARKVRSVFGTIDVLVNNAGVGSFVPFRKQTVSMVERQVRTNFEGLIRMTRAFLPLVRRAVVNVASVAGETAYAEMSVYCGTKFGVRGFTQALAQEEPRLAICCVNPDMTATRLSGYKGRPPTQVAEVIFRAAAGQVTCRRGGDIDVAEVIP